MRLVCHLRSIRGDRTLLEVAAAAQISEGELSKIERGMTLPRDAWIPGLEEAYGKPLIDWYDAAFGLAVVGDA